MLFTFELKTPAQGLINITAEVEEAIKESGILEGICVVFYSEQPPEKKPSLCALALNPKATNIAIANIFFFIFSLFLCLMSKD